MNSLVRVFFISLFVLLPGSRSFFAQTKPAKTITTQPKDLIPSIPLGPAPNPLQYPKKRKPPSRKKNVKKSKKRSQKPAKIPALQWTKFEKRKMTAWNRARTFWSMGLGVYHYQFEKTAINNPLNFDITGVQLEARMGYGYQSSIYQAHLFTVLTEEGSSFQLGGSMGFVINQKVILELGLGLNMIFDDRLELPILQFPLEAGITVRTFFRKKMIGLRLVTAYAFSSEESAFSARLNLVLQTP